MNISNSNDNTSFSARDMYKAISKVQTHLVQSTEIAKTCLCPYLFKLDYPFGVTKAQRDYVVANTVHAVMSLALPSTILNNWQYGLRKDEYENVVRRIENDSKQIVDDVLAEKLDWIRRVLVICTVTGMLVGGKNVEEEAREALYLLAKLLPYILQRHT